MLSIVGFAVTLISRCLVSSLFTFGDVGTKGSMQA